MRATPRSLLSGITLLLAALPVARAEEPAGSPEATRTVAPEHPPELLARKVAGEAEIECVVGVDGRVSEARVASASQPEFGEAALAAVKQWEFKPGRKDGNPVAMRVTIPIEFQVPGEHPLEQFAKRRLFVAIEGDVVPAESMPNWPMPKQLLAPSYPEALRGTGKRGKAVVSVIIDRQGRVVNPRLVKATWPEFELPALAAAVSLEFPPQLGPGKNPVNVSMDLQFDFRDDGKAARKLPAKRKRRNPRRRSRRARPVKIELRRRPGGRTRCSARRLDQNAEFVQRAAVQSLRSSAR